MKRHLWLSFFLLLLDSVRSRPSVLTKDNPRYPDRDELLECGRIRDVIPRDSGRYRKILIRNTNDDALYANDDCRRMTSRAKSKLDVLASTVKRQWSGVKVKVLLAWTDQVDQSDLTSLHYEGRSVRLVLSDGDTRKLGKLGALAIEAGFDWVQYYPDKNYIRASVIPDVCQTSVDLVFLLDGSGSVGEDNFLKVKNFVKKVIDFFNIGPSGTHVAVVTYETGTHEEFNLKEYYTKSEMQRAVDDIPYRGYLTYTGEALDFVRLNIFTKAGGMRSDPGIPKVLVLLTDGHSNGKDVYRPAEAVRNLGVSIFSIGVGSSVSVPQLNAIATDPDKNYVYQLHSFSELADWVDRLSAVSCSEGSLIKSCENAVTTVTSGSFKYFRTEFEGHIEQNVSVEIKDLRGISHLYASAKSKNPGPLDPDSGRNEENSSPKAVSVNLGETRTLFVAVQGQEAVNEFSLSFWDNLFAQSTFEVSVKEGLPATNIANLTLVKSTYSLVYSISYGNDAGNFRIEKDQPMLWTTKALDRESVSQFKLVVVAEDTKNKCRRSRTLVLINVLDSNDHNPRFTKNPYTASIHENSPSGTPVKKVEATDTDSGVNGQITYNITAGNPGRLFRIESDGQVFLQGPLDYETEDTYTLTIEAHDGGKPSRSGSTTLQISVLDVNESPSIRCDGSCILMVSEGAGSGTTVGTVSGSDPDTKSSCSLKYGIPSIAKNTFTVNSNGEIKTKVALDREIIPQYVFFVTVQDCAVPALSASVKVTVNVQDINDNDPTFYSVYSVDIAENEVVGSNVVSVKAIDPDEGSNGEVRYSFQGSDSSSFEIDAVTGRITTKVKLDYETKTKYIFNVTATDQGPGSRKGSTRVTVNVLDVNDNKPEFKNTPYTATVAENATRGTPVKTIEATDEDSGSNGDVKYSIVSGNLGDAFVIDSTSGDITVNSNLDRETRSSYTLVVQASDQGSPSQSTRTTVAITIGDVNDNSPVFQGLPYEKSVSENLDVNDLIVKVSATDDDDGSFGQVSYSIGSPVIAKETFKVDASGNILLKKKLDYETTKSYNFKVVATDGGGRSTEADVKVLVEDYNDNKPNFTENPYKASVAENANIGDAVKTVTATDEDSGPRGRVTYSITGGNFGNAFSISASGAVNVASRLDRETRETYSLTIKASDDGSPSSSSTTIMDINVTDINDNKPTFGQASYSFTIAENNALNAPVGRLGPATDSDKGVNSEIVYSIVSGNTAGAFEFRDTGELIAKIVLDREKISSYSLVIEARDKGIPSLYTQVPVQVTVEDENDNTPEFSEKPYNCQIDENSAENSFVCFVRATDEDDGVNGTVTYEMVSTSAEFAIDQNNGTIRARVTLDREQNASYSIQVRAKDGGTPAKRSTVTVNVKVIDKNDNEPLFNQTTYAFDVSEGAAPTTRVGRVLATDKDEGPNGQVVYAITRGNIGTAFEIDQNNGDIKVKSKLDRETLASYALIVQATDQGSSPKFSSRQVFINIKDVNDNDPIFTESLYTGLIAEDTSIGSTVVQVKATDADEGINAKITYTITEGQNKDDFSIEPDTGVIRTAKTLDYEKISSYEINVTATDGGNPSRSSTSRVNITVENTNDNAPTFVASSPSVSISEGVANGTEVVKFNATDKDGNALRFSIASGNTDNALAIDVTSGLLTTNKKLDRETVPRYNLTVTVTDSGDQSSSQNLSVIVLDVNDNKPVFDPSSYAVNVTENDAAGPIVTVKATDKDEGDNAKISFTIDSTSAQKFRIDSVTGVISTKNPLDFENGAQYIIQVTAKDAGTPSLSSVATVTVTVIDQNDNRPFFKSDYVPVLPENTATGKTVVRVEATDLDSGVNGEIQYNITSGNEAGFFALNPTTGGLTVAKPPDRETQPSFTLTVIASNKVPFTGSPPSAKTNCTITITIEDVNDNAPIITNSDLRKQVKENSKSSTLVFDVDATDKDAGANGEIVYRIVSGNVKGAFAINPQNGIVTVNGSIDRETLDSYTLKIRASDKGTPDLFSEKDFTVNIIDEDDNAPVFIATPYDASVREDVPTNTTVTRVIATDKDIDDNGRISYSITSGNDQGYFKIDSVEGHIRTNALLDYEKIKEYNLGVTAKDTKHAVNISLRIDIVNVNDNDPVLAPNGHKITISENATRDEGLLTLKATDKDPFGSLTYTIQSGNNENKFALDPRSGELSIAADLDRETTDFYNLSVRVTDGGVPARSDYGFVEIRITDANDNAPKFNKSSESGTVRENSDVGNPVLTVHATDEDVDVNAEVEYIITKGNKDGSFKLDSKTGALLVNATIDRETTTSFTLEITARDKGSPSLESPALRVDIQVLDENDNDPLFSKKSYHRNLKENLSPKTFVEEVKATDDDIGANGAIVYSIQSGSYGHFVIDNNTGIVETTIPLDRENISSYAIIIEAKDKGTPSRNSKATLFINVLDDNDNAPVFNVSSLEANVTEERKDVFVTKIVATDRDVGNNSQIEYELSTVLGRNKLTIDRNTGVVRTREPFDYENEKRVTFQVTASDKGNPSLTTTADLIVNVVDIDDNCPEFFPKEYNVTIVENLGYSNTIVRVTATDKDSEDNKDLNYGIRSGDDVGRFRINSATGDISPSPAFPVDREDSPSYHLVVRAGNELCGVIDTDSGDENPNGPLSKSVAKVNIIVTDVNDNAPQFLEESYNYVFSNIYTSQLLWVNATDKDEGINAEFDFSLANVERVNSKRTLTVVATDKGVPSLSSNTTLTVTMDKGVSCEAMSFDVSPRGNVTVKTLCIFNKVEFIGDALVGETMQLKCSAVGNTVPEYRWTRNGVPLTDWSKTGDYVIKSLSKDDTGDYYCAASSDAGTIVSKTLKLKVEEPPTIILHPKDTFAEIGRKAVLHCRARGDEPIEYSWYKNNQLLPSTGDLNTDQRDLVFNKIIAEDDAKYFCAAKNKVKDEPAISKTAYLQVLSEASIIDMSVTLNKPRPKESCHYFNITDVKETLDSLAGGDVVVVEFNKPKGMCNLTQCSSDPCKNQGKCVPKGSSFVCQCPIGWTGDYCEKDKDECEPGTCGKNGTCTNTEGSFFCTCQAGSFGKRCQFTNKICQPNPCQAGQCYPRENANGYQCITSVTTVSMVFKLDESKRPWENWMKYDVAKEIENAIKESRDTAAKKETTGKRRRRDVKKFDYTTCLVRVKNFEAKGTELDLEIVLVCGPDRSGDPGPSSDYVCEAMFAEGKVSSCTSDKGTRTEAEPTEPPTMAPVKVNLAFIVRDSNGKDTEAWAMIDKLEEKDLGSKLEVDGLTNLKLSARTAKVKKQEGGLSLGVIAGIAIVAIALLIVAIAIVFVFIRTRKNKGNKQQDTFNMADRSPTKNSQLKKTVSMRELNESEVRGVLNMGYDEIRNEYASEDHTDGVFMVNNPEFTKKDESKYMDELESSPWYHGCISRGKAEDLLNDSCPEGTFLVRAGIKEGEFYVSVKAPEGGPGFHHIEVDRYEDEFVAVCGPSADTMEFVTFQQLIEYLQSNPTYFEKFDYDIILKSGLSTKTTSSR